MRNNAAWMPKDTVTVIDVLESGACYEGVRNYIATTMVISGPPSDTEGTKMRLSRVALNDGDCYGSGYGFGSVYGYGYGFGSGSGYGYGSGDGSGFGYGDGYGDGYGYGYGDGSGDGYGYGYGDGYGSGEE